MNKTNNAYNIFSKLNFEKLPVGKVNTNPYQDDNTYSNFSWTFSDTTLSELEVKETNGVKIINIKTNNSKLFNTDNILGQINTNFKASSFQLEININVPSFKANNIFFNIASTGNIGFRFDIKRTRLEINCNNKTIVCNYDFVENTTYNIVIGKIGATYFFIIDGMVVGKITSDDFNNNLNHSLQSITIGASSSAYTTNVQEFNGNINNINISYGNFIKYTTAFTKYGEHLLSRYNFANYNTNSASTYYCDIETLINPKLTWVLDNPINNALNGYYKVADNKFTASLPNTFTMMFELRNKVNVSDISLVNLGDYQIKYNLIKIGEPEPEVIVSEYTTSALDFENELNDKITKTIWAKEGNANITNNKIFGDYSFETKALGDSLSTNSKVLSGGNVPFTIDYYLLYKGKATPENNTWDAPIFTKYDNADQGNYLNTNTYNLSFYKSILAGGSADTENPNLVFGKIKLLPNTINKITMSYDNSAIRIFINDKLDNVIGSNGLSSNNKQLRFLSRFDDIHSTNKLSSSFGIIDNINIFDGIATKVRDIDPYEENLIVDLAFDGENNSTKIVDNSKIASYYNDSIVSILHFKNNINDIIGNNWIPNNVEYGEGVLGCGALTKGSISCADNGKNNPAWQMFYDPIGSLDFYIKRGDSNVNNYIFSYWSSDIRWKIAVSNTELTMDVYIGSQQTIKFNLPQRQNNFELFSLTRHSNNQWELFVDGVSCGKSGAFDGVVYAGIGQSIVIDTINGLHQLSMIRFIKGVDIYNSGAIVPTSEYTYIKKNKWAIYGNAKLSTTQKFNGFSSLNVSSGSNVRTNIEQLLNDDFTISFEVFTQSFSSYDRLFQIGTNSTKGCLILYGIPNSNVIHSQIVVSGTSYSNIISISNSSYKHGTTNKIILTRKKGIFKFYINDILMEINSNFIDYNITETIFTIGANSINSEGINGYFKNFKIYKGISFVPNSPNGQIQLDFDNNFNDKYNNSTWINNGVTFDQVNSVKGNAGYFTNGNNYIETSSETFNYKYNDFSLKWDMKPINGRSIYSELFASEQSSWVNGCSAISCFDDGTVRIASFYNNIDTSFGGCNVKDGNYYKVNFNKINDVIHSYLNDVITSSSILSTRYSGVLPQFNFNKIGKGLWSGNNVGYRGYIDNVKSYKEDLVNLNTTYLHVDSIFSKEIKNENLVLKYSEITNPVKYYTVLFDDSPSLKDFICEVDVFIPSSVYQQCRIAFRTSNFDYAEDERLGYTAYIADDYIMFGRGGNGSSSWYNEQRTSLIKYKDDSYHKFKVIANGSSIKIYIDNDLIFDLTDSTYNDVISKIALRGNGGYNIRTTMIKSFKISDLNNNELYYKDWKTKIENNITNTAVNLPLETNSNNIGFTPLTVNAVGTPTYSVVDGKKCIKFESGKYLTINNNNIFNFGTSSDFYIEVDIYPQLFHDNGYGHSILSNGYVNGQNAMWLQYLPNTLGEDSNKVEFAYYNDASNNNTTNLRTKNKINVMAWNKIKFYRKGNILTIDLNGEINNWYFDKTIHFGQGNSTHLGMIFNVSNQATMDGYMSNFKMFVGTHQHPETYNQYKVLDLDFKPTRKSYLFKDNNNKCIIHPVNITQRDYQDSKYCCTFNGTNQYLQLGKNDLLNFGNDDFVINIKFKKEGVIIGNESLISSGEVSSVVGRVGILLDPSTNQVYIHTNTNSGYFYLASSNTITSGINELLIVKNDGVISLILNNVTTTGSFKYALNLNINGNTNIGWYALTNNYFNGQIYSIKVLRNTTDLSLLENPEDVYELSEKFELTNGTDSQLIEYADLNNRELRVISDDENLSLHLNEDILKVPKTTKITDVVLFDGYKGDVKDLRVYNVAFDDKDVFEGSQVINTEYPDLYIYNDDNYVEDLNVIDIGDYVFSGFIEGYTDRKYRIYNKAQNYILLEGVEDYEYNGINYDYFDEYEIHDLVNGQRYPLYKHEMVKGFIAGSVNLKNCGVKSVDLKVYCYRNDNSRLIGVYDLNDDGTYSIPNLDVNSYYDIIFKDQNRKIENISSSYRKPKSY